MRIRTPRKSPMATSPSMARFSTPLLLVHVHYSYLPATHTCIIDTLSRRTFTLRSSLLSSRLLLRVVSSYSLIIYMVTACNDHCKVPVPYHTDLLLAIVSLFHLPLFLYSVFMYVSSQAHSQTV